MSNQRLMKVKEKAGDGYAKTNAIARGGGEPVVVMSRSGTLSALDKTRIADSRRISGSSCVRVMGHLLGAHQTGQLTCYNTGQTICS